MDNNSNEIKIIRTYEASVKAVWEAWADLKKVSEWWGPRGNTITTSSRELKPGGNWIFTMHSPDGVDYSNKTHYFEVEKYSKLVYDHGANNAPPMFRVAVVFTEFKGGTKMDMSLIFPSVQVANATRKFIKKVGGDSTWDRLAEYLKKEASGKECFTINRSFDAPLAALFEMWTNPKHLTKWVPPTGFNMEMVRGEIKPGKNTFSVMTGGNIKMYAKAEYIKIEKPHCIVYTQQFVDEHEKLSRHPMSATWPETLLTTVKFSEEGENQTRVTLTWEPYGSTTHEELQTFIKARGGMAQGWTGSFDKLELYLSSEKY